ncbi:MAG: hypothetical protein U0M15_07415 [Bacillota bacterium]|nr:hypothetical protein [Bacillota bacterium]
MLATIACFPIRGSSSLLFDYADEGFLSSNVKRVQKQIAMAQAAGEPMQSVYRYKKLNRPWRKMVF